MIVDYGLGNLGSIKNMLHKLGYTSKITSDLGEIAHAHKLILPGVGSFDKGMSNLESKGIRRVLDKRVLEDKVPVLGICLGMQLMTRRSDEGKLAGLSWVDGECLRFDFSDKPGFKVPHMGWNYVNYQDNAVINDNSMKHRFYFVHSYYVKIDRKSEELFSTTYGHKFTSGFKKDNIIGVQFHPEKSHKFGMKLLRNFLEL